MTTLNQQQQEAIRHYGTPLLIVAGAGSGKTTVITHKIRYLITEVGMSPESILAITFTNRAAREMKERVQSLCGDCTTPPMVSTFHAFSAYVLRRHFHCLGGSQFFSIIDIQEQTRLLKTILSELNITDQKYTPAYISTCLGSLKNELVGPRAYQEGRSKGTVDTKLAAIYQRYQMALWQNQALDFADLLYWVNVLFEHHPDVLSYYQSVFQYILVDEYQDTNHAQYMLVKQLVGTRSNLTVVGDFDQNIYSWRGANIQNILQFEKDYSNAIVIKLEENYRSTQHILNAANAVIQHNKQRKEKNLWTSNPDGEKLRYYFGPDEHSESRFVIQQIQKRQKGGQSLNDMVVLFRINALSRIYEEGFSQARIPFKIVGGVAFFQRKEIKDVMAYLRLIGNPNDNIAFLRVANVPARQIGDVTLKSLQEQSDASGKSIVEMVRQHQVSLPARSMAKVVSFAALIDELKKEYDDSKTDRIGRLLKAVLEKTGYKAMLENSFNPQDQERLENILQFISIAREEELTLDEFIMKLSLATEFETQDQSAQEAVTLMTMHHAKGLEYQSVFIVGMEEGMLPHYRALQDDVEMEEERRLCYVAMTRGKEYVCLSGAQQRNIFGEPRFQKPSRFIDEIPVECVSIAQGSVQRTPFSRRETASSSIENIEVPVYQIGEQVSHAVWGTGVIQQVHGNGADATLHAVFNGKLKKLLAKYAPLTKLEGP